MMRITIISPANRKTSGSLSVTDSNGTQVLGPFPIAVGSRPSTSGIDPEGTSESAAAPRVGSYVIRCLVPMAGASVEDVRKFGRYGFVVLEPANEHGKIEMVTDTEYISIHGGDLSESGQLRSASGSIRLANRDQRELINLIGDHGMRDFECMWIESDQDGPAEVCEASVENSPVPYAKFAAIPAIMAIAAPFVVQSPAYAQCSLYDSGSAFSACDFSYILDNEGGDQLNGYVPNSSSGVTIAGGLDLGFQTSQQMLSMGFSSSQVAVFTPYLATSSTQPLIGQAARNVLAQQPLSIAQAHASLIDNVVYSWNTNAVAGLYNTAVQKAGRLPGVTFSSLPVAWQTAIADMYFAYAPFATTTCFNQLAAGEWTAAIASLRNFGGPNKTINDRAKADGDYLATKTAGLPT